jgi:hypothetical protein
MVYEPTKLCPDQATAAAQVGGMTAEVLHRRPTMVAAALGMTFAEMAAALRWDCGPTPPA